MPDDVSSLPWAFDGGSVLTSQTVGRTMILGGSFRAMARRSDVIGPFGLFEATTARLMAADPALAGSWTRALVSDGTGGWFLGGRFLVDGEVRSLVRLDAFGRRVAWAPDVSGGDLLVSALARVGTRLFVGGTFASVQGVPRDGFAAIDIPSQQVLPQFSPAPRGGVRALHVSGGSLFIGGTAELTKIDLATGTVAPNWPVAIAVNAIATSGSRVFVGANNADTLFAFDAVTAAMTPFGPTLSELRNGPAGERGALALVAANGTLYVGGTFAAVGGQPRLGAAAIDASTGVLAPWAPLTSRGNVLALAASGGDVYLGGDLAPPANGFAIKVDGTTGAESATWRPRLGNSVDALAVDGAGVAVGGFFSVHRAVARTSLAAFDLDSGDVVPMPYTDGAVRVMTVAGRTLYFGGTFFEVNGQPRTDLAAFDLDAGVVTPFDARVAFQDGESFFPGDVNALTVTGQDLLVGGYFFSVGGQPRTLLAAVDAQTGAVRPFAPSVANSTPLDRALDSFALVGGRLWVAGRFTVANGTPRSGLAAFDPVTGALDPLTPQPALSGVPRIVAAVGGLLQVASNPYLGSRPALVFVDASTGVTSAWPGPIVRSSYDVSVADDGLAVISTFGPPGSAPAFAAYNLTTGTNLGWSVTPLSPSVWLASMRADLDGVLVNGFTLGGAGSGWPVEYYARRHDTTTPVAVADLGVHVQGDLVTVRWTPSSLGALPTSYRLVVGSQPGASDVADFPFPRDANALRTVAPAGTYHLRVVPQVNGVDGPASPDIGFVVGVPGCAAPPVTAPGLTVISGASPRLEWTAPSDVAVNGYEVRAGLIPGVYSAARIPLPASSHALSTAGVPPGVYYVSVVALSACGTSPLSNEVQVVVPVLGVPAPPTNVMAQVANRTVTLAWTAPTGSITGYVLEAGSAPGLANLVPGLALGSSTAFTVPAVPPGRYYVRVRAASGAAISPASNEIVVDVP